MKAAKRSKNKAAHTTFICRLCRKVHGLKACWRFRDMNTMERRAVVKKYGYCPNCLAHSHSQGSCFTKTGCGYCSGRHHSLLHIHSRLQQRPTSATGTELHLPTAASTYEAEKKPSTATTQGSANTTSGLDTMKKSTSLTAILHQNLATLLPTALIKIDGKTKNYYARCLLDSGSRMSCISKRFVEKIELTTLELDNEIICPVTLWSCVDSHRKIDVTLRVNNRITTRTPKESLPDSIKGHFTNVVLADKHFYKSSSVDIILGVDVYSKIISDGIFIRAGLPTAQNTIFGVVLFGAFSTLL